MAKETVDSFIEAQISFSEDNKDISAEKIAECFGGKSNSIIRDSINTIMNPRSYAYKLFLTSIVRHRSK